MLAAAIAALALAACGGGSGGSSGAQDVDQLLTQTFGPDKPIKSGKLNLGLDLDTRGIASVSGPVSLKLTGPFQSQGRSQLPKFAFTLDLSQGAQSFTAGATSTGDKGFVSFQGQAYALSDQLFNSFKQGFQQAQKQSGAKESSAPSLASLGVDPRRWLEDPKNVGSAQVGGTETIHISSGIDVEHLLDDVNTLLGKADKLGRGQVAKSLTPRQRDALARSVKDAKVDIYTGKDDKMLRRLTLQASFAVPNDLQSKAGGLTSGAVKVDLTIADLNQPQTITAPANAKPFSDLTSALQGLVGGTSSGGSGSSGSGSSGSGATPQASKKYLDCLQRAGNDVAKVQKCASLVGAQ